MFDPEILLIILAGGMFGVVLRKFLDTTPDWVFWMIVVLFFLVTAYLLTA